MRFGLPRYSNHYIIYSDYRQTYLLPSGILHAFTTERHFVRAATRARYSGPSEYFQFLSRFQNIRPGTSPVFHSTSTIGSAAREGRGQYPLRRITATSPRFSLFLRRKRGSSGWRTLRLARWSFSTTRRAASLSPAPLQLHPRRNRPSFEPLGSSKDLKGCWVSPSVEELPIGDDAWPNDSTQPVYLLTRGKQTHIMPFPSPLPALQFSSFEHSNVAFKTKSGLPPRPVIRPTSDRSCRW